MAFFEQSGYVSQSIYSLTNRNFFFPKKASQTSHMQANNIQLLRGQLYNVS